MITHYRDGRIFTASDERWATSLLVEDGRIVFAGSIADAEKHAPDAEVIGLDGAFVLPGFVDAHTHLVMMGQAMHKVDLFDARDVPDIQARLRAASEADPAARHILGRSWLHTALHGEPPSKDIIDAVISDRPVYLDSNDCHSAWVNSAALRELGIDSGTPDPIGGRIERDGAGQPTGMLYETAVTTLVWPHLARGVSDDDRDKALSAAFDHYLRDGVTSAIDMAMNPEDLATLDRARRADGSLPMRVAAHWLITREESVEANLRQVREAARISQVHNGPWLDVVGIKLILDGVIDSCTAAMKEPYSDGSHSGPIWDREALRPVVAEADALGLQIAMHAIGDEASEIALDAVEYAIDVNGEKSRRHRIEHLETVTEENVQRLARLGVVASMQPVHADPAIQDNWRAMLGDHRVKRGFPWPEITDAGAVLALGSDAPTAPHPPLPNMYIATTRKSAIDPELPANLPQYALPMVEALTHATRDAAYSCRWESLTGQLRPGLAADFVVLDDNPFESGAESLREMSVRMTVVNGRVVHGATHR
ncbi:amidohydrolase [Hoyosella altamirensis]|uniref:Amidohydrolase 3 domain-containing protein n=1 Tax=Hoyosella altamirensis TaxID=616997 RepID=A0A839RRZ3_9ACTN|nr:amidohydrolase [Hoyosella altamirensis]MBB3039089.1 hypothetical protein [Hoyosella altamirensis]